MRVEARAETPHGSARENLTRIEHSGLSTANGTRRLPSRGIVTGREVKESCRGWLSDANTSLHNRLTHGGTPRCLARAAEANPDERDGRGCTSRPAVPRMEAECPRIRAERCRTHVPLFRPRVGPSGLTFEAISRSSREIVGREAIAKRLSGSSNI